MDPAPEGSDERRLARMQLLENASVACLSLSFDAWLESEKQALIDAVTERDLESIFQLTWRKRRRCT